MGRRRKKIITHKTFNARLKKVGLTLAAICEHVYYWLDPVYVKPAHSEADRLHRMDWIRLLSRKLWTPSEDSEAESTIPEKKLAEQCKKTHKLVNALVGCIESSIELWKKEVSIRLAHKQFFIH